LLQRSAEVEIAVVTSLLAKRDMDVNAGQGGKLSLKEIYRGDIPLFVAGLYPPD
jgi:hypothetical protein